MLPIGFKIDLNNHAIVDDYIDALSFLCSAIREKEFTIAQMKIPLLNDDDSQRKIIKQYDSLLIFSQTIRGFIKSVGYSKPFSLLDLKPKDVDLIAHMYIGYKEGLVDYSLVSISLFSKMIARVMKNDNILFFDVFNPVLYDAVKFKANNNLTKRTTTFIYFSVDQWSHMEVPSLLEFESIIKKNVSLDNKVVDEYRGVVNRLSIAYKKTGREILLLYADFLNNYFRFFMNLEE